MEEASGTETEQEAMTTKAAQRLSERICHEIKDQGGMSYARMAEIIDSEFSALVKAAEAAEMTLESSGFRASNLHGSALHRLKSDKGEG